MTNRSDGVVAGEAASREAAGPDDRLVTSPATHWKGMPLREQLREWRERALEAEADCDRLRADHSQSGRLREGLRRLANRDYDSGYTAESFADAVLRGWEPSGEATM